MGFAKMGHLQGRADRPGSWLTVSNTLQLECMKLMLSTASAQWDYIFWSREGSNFSKASLVSFLGQCIGR